MFSTLINKFSSMVLQNDCYQLQLNMLTFSKHTMDQNSKYSHSKFLVMLIKKQIKIEKQEHLQIPLCIVFLIILCNFEDSVVVFLLILKSVGNRLKLVQNFLRKANIQFVIDLSTKNLITRKNQFNFMLKNNVNTFVKHVYFKKCQE